MVFHGQIYWLIDSIAELTGYGLVAIVMLLIVFVATRWWKRRRFTRESRLARISMQELKQLSSDGRAPIILDVRSHSARLADARRIPGAVIADLNDFKVTGASPDSEIVVYCDCPNEASAAQVARLLMERGFKRVHPLAGGLDAWAEAGLPVAPIAIADGKSTPVSDLRSLGGFENKPAIPSSNLAGCMNGT